MYAAISAVTNSNANLILVATDDFIKRRVCLVYVTRLKNHVEKIMLDQSTQKTR